MTSGDEQPTVNQPQSVEEEMLAMKKAVEEYEERVQTTQTELSEAQQFVIVLEQKLNEVEKTNHNLQLQNSELREEFDTSQQDMKNHLEAKIEELIISHEEESEQWKKKNMNAIAEWTKATENSSMLAEELAEAQKAMEKEAKNIADYQQTLEQERENLQEERAKVQALTAMYDETVLALEQERAKVEDLTQTNAQHVKALEEQSANLEQIEKARHTLNASQVNDDEERRSLSKALDEETRKVTVLRVTLDNMQEELKKSKAETRKVENKLKQEKQQGSNEENWEEKFKEEEARSLKYENELNQKKRLLKEQKGSTTKALKDVQKAQQEIERLEALREKEEKKLRNEIAELWDSTQKHAELLDSSIEESRAKARQQDIIRIKELEEKLAESERDHQVTRARLGTAERELVNSKKKAKKQNQGASFGRETILLRPEVSEITPVEAMQKKINSVKAQHIFLTLGFVLVIVQLFFPSLLTYKK